jgi:hypothetical protein
MRVYIYIYIYIYRERERERESCLQTTRALVDLQGLFTLQLSCREAWTRKDPNG